jgi:hypothetical protein
MDENKYLALNIGAFRLGSHQELATLSKKDSPSKPDHFSDMIQDTKGTHSRNL